MWRLCEGSLPHFGDWSSAVGAPYQQHLPRRERQDGSSVVPLDSGGAKCWYKAHSRWQRLWRITTGRIHPHAQTRKTCSKAWTTETEHGAQQEGGKEGEQQDRSTAPCCWPPAPLPDCTSPLACICWKGWVGFVLLGVVSLKQIGGWTCKSWRSGDLQRGGSDV